MIVRLCEDTPKLGLRIVQPGCSGAQLMDRGIEMAIVPASCPAPEQLVPVWEDCELKWYPRRKPVPSLIYPAFEVDDDGLIVWYFDQRLWDMPPGRYIGHVMLEGHCISGDIFIDLCNRPVIIDQAVVVSVPACGDTEC